MKLPNKLYNKIKQWRDIKNPSMNDNHLKNAISQMMIVLNDYPNELIIETFNACSKYSKLKNGPGSIITTIKLISNKTTVTKDEACKLLNVQSRSIRRYIKNGQLHPIKKVRQQSRFDKREIEKLLYCK